MSRLEPVERLDEDFQARHTRYVERGRSPIDLLFLGDSITRRWEDAPDLWQTYFGDLNAANFSVGGDTANNLLWRLEHGELDHARPQLAVLLIGTNNTDSMTGREIYQVLCRILEVIQKKSPLTKILVQAVFPREGEREMLAVSEVNDLLRAHTAPNLHYRDWGHLFLKGSQVDRELMPDGLHLSRPAYILWGEVLKPTLEELLGD